MVVAHHAEAPKFGRPQGPLKSLMSFSTFPHCMLITVGMLALDKL
ncbi:hypothetical protein C4D60_Mb06t06930 [Musa balbisiana]|uniref:Uncharacterized protein n=1 Tax=Musa balbisiana TaxID=52838 RepID=A0A4S8ILW9_MUSBA|nr:hypothetical protein C4D60_Mb06t06930 [Musa balbisiana]